MLLPAVEAEARESRRPTPALALRSMEEAPVTAAVVAVVVAKATLAAVTPRPMEVAPVTAAAALLLPIAQERRLVFHFLVSHFLHAAHLRTG